MKNVKLFCKMLLSVKDAPSVDIYSFNYCFAGTAYNNGVIDKELRDKLAIPLTGCWFFDINQRHYHSFIFLHENRKFRSFTGRDYYNEGRNLLRKYKCLSHLTKMENELVASK